MPTPIIIDVNAVDDNGDAADINNSSGPYHFHALGAVWCFTGTVNSGIIRAFKSIDDGLTWAEQDAGNGPTSAGNPPRPAMFFDGANTVYIVVPVRISGGTPPVQVLEFHSFDLSSATFGGVIGPQSTILRRSQGVLGLVQFSDFTFRVFYNDDEATISHTVYFQDFNGSAWSNETAVASGVPDGDATWIQILVNSDICHVVYQLDSSQTGYWYVQISRSGTLSSAFNFTQTIDQFSATPGAGLVEIDKDCILFAVNIQSPGSPMYALRGTPISSPVWSQEVINDALGNYELNSNATLVRNQDGSEQVFWTFLSFIGPDFMSASSAIATATNTGSGWSVTSTVYDIQLNPFSSPIPNFCTRDQILYLSAEVFGSNIYIHFDGFSANLSNDQPNFTFSLLHPAPPTVGKGNYIYATGGKGT